MIYLISISILFFSYYLFKKVAGSMALNRLNMISVVFYFYLVFMSYIGAVFIANGFGNNPVINQVNLENRYKGWLIISYVMIALPLGILLSKYLFRIKNVENLFNNYSLSPIVPLLSNKDSYIRIFLYILSILAFLSSIYMIIIVKKIPQIQLFTLLSQSDVLVLRNSINRGFEGIYPIKSILFEQLIPLLSYISYSYYRMTNSFKDKIWFYSMFFLSLFMLTFTLSKSPLVSYGIIFIILKIYIDGYIKWKYFIIFILIILLGIFIMFILIVRDSNFEFILIFLFDRIFFDQISGTFLMIQIFPDIYHHLGFSSLSRPLSEIFLGTYSEPATRITMEYAFPIATKNGLMNLLSTLFIGEAWANFGFLGILISPIYVGFIIGSFYYFVLKSKKTPILLGLLAYFSFKVNLASQFNQYIYNSTVFALLLLLLFSYIFALMLKQTKVRGVN
jgi:hypothetical protein